jgi:hypothetical protein
MCKEEEKDMQNTMKKTAQHHIKLDHHKLAEKAMVLPVKNGVIRLKRDNPAHRAWMEDNR